MEPMQRLLLQVLALAASLTLVSSSSLTFQVEPKEQECFYEQLEKGKSFSMNFEVIRGGLLDIKLTITDPVEQVLFDKLAFFNRQDSALNEAEGKVSFVAQNTGTYKFCFDNRMSRWTAKVASFSMNAEAKPAHEEIAKLEHLGPVVDSIIKISDTLTEVEKIQHHLRVVEQSSRDAAEQTNGRVQWLAIIESALLFTISFVQLRYIRNWFDSGRPNRV